MTNKFYDGMLIANITRQISETGRINDPIPVHKLIDAFKAQSAELERLRDVATNKATRCDELYADKEALHEAVKPFAIAASKVKKFNSDYPPIVNRTHWLKLNDTINKE